MKSFGYIVLLCFAGLWSCNKDASINTVSESNNWLVNISDIIHFDSELDKIKSLDTFQFLPIAQVNLNDNVKVAAYSDGNIVHVYSMATLESHEIINDSIDDNYFSISHCPLTASTLAWNRFIKGKVNSFGVSGKLYKENLIPYDRNTKSHWSQMLSLCINGDFIGEKPQNSQVIRTKFSTLKNAYPDAMFLFHADCDSSSCTIDFKSVEDEPVDGDNSDINDLERYFGIVNESSAVLLPLSEIPKTLSVRVIFAFNRNMVFVSGTDDDLRLVFETGGHVFSLADDNLPIIMQDELGNKYDIFGYVVSGPDIGNRLNSPIAYTANTFAWKDLFSKKDVIEL